MIREIFKRLQAHYPTDHAQTIGWWLVEAATHKSKLDLITQKHQLSNEQSKTLTKWVDEHINEHKPLQYILGAVPFGPLTIEVSPPTLIPRPETETWCAQVIKNLAPLKNKRFNILDMCTGSGCIGLWLAKEFPKAHVYAVDIAKSALDCAQKNAQKHTLNNVTFIQSDLFKSVPEKLTFDVVISNPPYVTDKEWLTLEPTVTVWEDKHALVANNEGLELIERIIKNSRTHIKPGSSLLIEIGYLQGQRVKDLFEKYNFEQVNIIQDDAKRDRLVVGVYNC